MARTKKESAGVKTARSGFVYVFGQSLGSVAVLVTFALLARMLTTTNWGLYSIIIAFYTFFGMLGNFSIGAAVRKKMAEQKSIEARKSLISNAYLASLTISLIIALFGVLISGYAATSIYRQPVIATSLMLTSALIVFWAIFNLTLAVLVAIEKVKEAAFIAIVYAVVQLIVAPLLVLLGYGVLGAIVGLGIGIIAGAILGLFYLFRSMGRIKMVLDLKQMKGILGFASPVYISYLVMQGVYSLGILLLGGYVSATIVGNYNIGYELGGAVSIILSTSMFVLLPAFSKIVTERKSEARIGASLNKSIYYTLLFLAPVVAYVVSISSPLTFVLFSHKYTYAPLYLSVVAVGLTIGIIWNYASTMMLGMGDTKRFLKYQLVSAAFELALLFGLTPTLKVAGMLLGLFVIFPIVMDIVYVMELKKSAGFEPQFGKPAAIALASIILFALLFISSRALQNGYITILANIVISVAIYPPLLALSRGIGKAEIAFLKRALGSRAVSRPVLAIIGYTQIFIRN